MVLQPISRRPASSPHACARVRSPLKVYPLVGQNDRGHRVRSDRPLHIRRAPSPKPAVLDMSGKWVSTLPLRALLRSDRHDIGVRCPGQRSPATRSLAHCHHIRSMGNMLPKVNLIKRSCPRKLIAKPRLGRLFGFRIRFQIGIDRGLTDQVSGESGQSDQSDGQ